MSTELSATSMSVSASTHRASAARGRKQGAALHSGKETVHRARTLSEALNLNSSRHCVGSTFQADQQLQAQEHTCLSKGLARVTVWMETGHSGGQAGQR